MRRCVLSVYVYVYVILFDRLARPVHILALPFSIDPWNLFIETLYLGSRAVGHGKTWMASASVSVIVKLIQMVLLHARFHFIVQVGTIIIEGIKVLRHPCHQLLEPWISFRAGSIRKEKEVSANE
jgi:hypothetical protein